MISILKTQHCFDNVRKWHHVCDLRHSCCYIQRESKCSTHIKEKILHVCVCMLL